MYGDKFEECGNNIYSHILFILWCEVLFFQDNDGDCCNNKGNTGCDSQ